MASPSPADQDAPAATPSTTTSPSSSPEPELRPEDQVRTLWEDAHQRRLIATHEDGPSDATVFADLADQDTADVLASLVAAGRPSVRSDLEDTQLGTEVTVAAGTATIRGCVLAAVRPTGEDVTPTLTTTLWNGEARQLPEGWRLTEVMLGTEQCVPAELSEGATGAYREWLEAVQAWWDPPNPDDPRIGLLMAEPAATAMRDILAEHVELGVAVRDTHDPTAAVVTDVEGSVVTVSDCYAAADGDAAAYDLESGERREDLTPSPAPGQLDAVIVELRRDDPERWVVSGWSTLVDVECEPGETTHVVIP